MGAMPFTEFFKGKKGSGGDRGVPAPPEFSASEKLAIVEQLESTGAACFWATDSKGVLTYLSNAIYERMGRKAAKAFELPLQHVFDPAMLVRQGCIGPAYLELPAVLGNDLTRDHP